MKSTAYALNFVLYELLYWICREIKIKKQNKSYENQRIYRFNNNKRYIALSDQTS